MNPIFKSTTSPQHRLILVLILSAAFIFFDYKMASFDVFRSYLQSMVSPLQYIANAPKQMMTWAAENIVTRRKLINENQQYRLNELAFHEQLMQFDIVKQENERLRSLLAAPVRTEIKKMVAEILSVDSDPYSHQVVINKGLNDGVYEGQPLIDEQGIVGQILHVGTTSSRVVLITDVTQAIPVRVQRNGIRLISSGSGHIDRLVQNFVPHSTDIQSGDLLVTSGLGGKYPEGYPVANVTIVSQNESRPFAQVYSRPVANIDRLRYLLLLFPKKPTSIFAPKQKGTAKKIIKNNSKNAANNAKAKVGQ